MAKKKVSKSLSAAMSAEIKAKFDLKGSMVKRLTKGDNLKNTEMLKDKNLLRMKSVFGIELMAG